MGCARRGQDGQERPEQPTAGGLPRRGPRERLRRRDDDLERDPGPGCTARSTSGSSARLRCIIWSWAEVLRSRSCRTSTVVSSDPDQAWILGELIRYLEHPKSGALDFADMGRRGYRLRESVSAGRCGPTTRDSPTSARVEAALAVRRVRLGRELGADVQVTDRRRSGRSRPLALRRTEQSLVGNGSCSERCGSRMRWHRSTSAQTCELDGSSCRSMSTRHARARPLPE